MPLYRLDCPFDKNDVRHRRKCACKGRGYVFVLEGRYGEYIKTLIAKGQLP